MSVLDDPSAPPLRVIELRDDAAGLDAFIVVDHELFPRSAGGTRMVPDVTVDEVARLARAMTWKFGVAHVPLAGAKAGIRFAGPPADREHVVGAYVDRIAQMRDVFGTGPDMGTHPADFLRLAPEGRTPMWARSHDGMSMDDLAVGAGILGASRAALASLGRTLEGARVAIEGFGKAGAGTAHALHRAGARVVAVSTIEGALVDPDGLDVDRLLQLKAEHGDRLVHHAEVAPVPRERLPEVECDVLVPGARPDFVTVDTVTTLRCAAIVPAANIPYGPGAVEALAERGILALPDFVANAGGVHLYEAPACSGDDPVVCLAAVERLIREASERVLAAADAEGITPTAAAQAVALDFLRAAAGR
jgi:glutamate dehydrogenase (NAD(P)+)